MATYISDIPSTYAMKTLTSANNKPYTQLDDATIGTPTDIIRAEVDTVFPFRDGVGAGTAAKDATGADIKDANNLATVVGPGVYRNIAYNAAGQILTDADGRPCFLTFNPSPSYYNTTDNAQKTTANINAPTAIAASVFMKWNTASQIEYILAKGTDIKDSANVAVGGKAAVIGPVGGQQVTAVLSADGSSVYIVENLTKSDFSMMSLADQTSVANTAYFLNTLSTQLGLVPSGSSKVGDARIAITNLINTAKGQIAVDAPAGQSGVTNSAYMNDVNCQVFLDQLINLQYRVDNGSAIFSPSDIQTKITEITTRYTRAHEFALQNQAGDTETPYTLGSTTIYNYVKSDDNNAGYATAFTKFMTQEKQILAVDNARLTLAKSGTLNDKKMDVPNLIFLLQLNYNLKDEAINNQSIEEVNQTNAMLRVYSAMQTLVNTVLGNFDTSETKETRSINGEKSSTFSSLSAENVKIVSMFSSTFASQVASPVENLKNVDRPTTGLIGIDGANWGFVQQKKNFWDQFSTKLSDKVTLLNQDSQIKMNDINSMQKEKDRHFDLANNALSKMADMIQNIARSVQ